MAKKYDLIVVLGSQPDPKTWKFPEQIYRCLDRAAELLRDDVAPLVATSGNRGIALDSRGLVQPFRECDELARYLIDKGVSSNKILKEGDSRDAISNLYYLKKQILIPHNIKTIVFVSASFRIARLTFLCERIFGDAYEVSFEGIEADEGITYNEAHTLKVQSEFLQPMKSGDHSWLDDKFYTAPMYRYWQEHDRKKYGEAGDPKRS
jgi:uncharacterized SAM-binding protein YcdF (DUF218 family)